MVRGLVLSGLAGLGLASCAPVGQAADALAQDQAKLAVNRIVSDQFPGVNAAPVTDCIIEAASAGEILEVAGRGPSNEAARVVGQIASRPEATQCIAENALALTL